MIKYVLIGLGALIAAFLIYAAFKPDSFRVERTLSIKAPAEKIFPLVDDFHQWSKWSPYENRDPAMKRTYSGAASGVGAIYEYDGNRDVGAGRLEILESTSPTKIRIKLDFLKPIEGHNIAEFTFVPRGDSTEVTWSMDGPSPYIAKVMGSIFNMDKMIGTDFAQGLVNMQAAVAK